MSLLSKAGLLSRIRRGRKDRARLVESNLDNGVAFQIRSTRENRAWTQGELARAAGMSQNNFSRLEQPDYGKYTISSLKRIAEALDVALVVRFVPFSQYVDWLSGTPYLDEGLCPEALAVPSFEDEEKSGKYQSQVTYYSLHHVPLAGSDVMGLVTPYSPQASLSVVETRGVYESAMQPSISERKAG